jgi:sterol 24-C-methyltransferase
MRRILQTVSGPLHVFTRILTLAGPDVVPWYYPLEGDIMKAQTLWDSTFLHRSHPPLPRIRRGRSKADTTAVLTVFRMTTAGKFITQNGVWALEKVGLVPKGTFDVGESLKTAATYLVKGGQKKLFT